MIQSPVRLGGHLLSKCSSKLTQGCCWEAAKNEEGDFRFHAGPALGPSDSRIGADDATVQQRRDRSVCADVRRRPLGDSGRMCGGAKCAVLRPEQKGRPTRP